MRVWNGDQRSRTSRAGMVLRIGCCTTVVVAMSGPPRPPRRVIRRDTMLYGVTLLDVVTRAPAMTFQNSMPPRRHTLSPLWVPFPAEACRSAMSGVLRPGKVLLPELRGAAGRGRARVRAVPFGLQRPQLDPADLAGDCLRQVGELKPPDALVGGEPLLGVGENCQRRLGGGLVAGREQHVCLGHGEPERVGRWHHRSLSHGLVLDQDAFQE